MKYGSIIVDPPWNYNKTSRNELLRGYSDQQYEPLTTSDLSALPVGEAASDDAVLMLWCTFPFLEDALGLVRYWGFTYTTAIPWVKANPVTGLVSYGVGYWFRGAAELVLIGRRSRSYRSQAVGLLTPPPDQVGGLVSPPLGHSRKPDDLHRHAEEHYPGPRLELFARRERPGWTVLGDGIDGRDIRASLADLLAN